LTDNSIEDETRNLISSRVRISVLGKGKAMLRPANLGAWLPVFDDVKAFEPEIAHLQMGGDFSDYLGWQFLRRYPVVSTFHDVETHVGEESRLMTPFIRFFRDRIRSNSDAIIVHGAFLREKMIREYNVPGDRVYSIPMGQSYLSAFRLSEDETPEEVGRTILFFGRIFVYKGLEYLIRAEPLVSERFPDIKIVIAGKGENFQKYHDMMGSRSSRFVIDNRHLPSDEAANLFRQCCLVVLPYIEGSQSAVIMDAYAFKKPVVVTSVGSLPEVVEDGKTGLVVPARDSKALAEAIIRLLGDAQLRRDMGEKGYHKLMTEQNWDVAAEKTGRVYADILKKQSSG